MLHNLVLRCAGGFPKLLANGLLVALQAVLAEAGSSLDRVVKAEVYLVAPEDFYEFKLVWREYFPSAPPARATAVVLDDHLVPGVRLSLQAVALASDAGAVKETIHVADVPDPMAAEWAPQATKAGIFVFPSALPATDFATGIPVKRNPIAPYYGSDAELQTHRHLRAVGQGAGGGGQRAGAGAEGAGHGGGPHQLLRHGRHLGPVHGARGGGAATLHRALSPKPNSAYLLGRDGSILFRAHWVMTRRRSRTRWTRSAPGGASAPHTEPRSEQPRLAHRLLRGPHPGSGGAGRVAGHVAGGAPMATLAYLLQLLRLHPKRA